MNEEMNNIEIQEAEINEGYVEGYETEKSNGGSVGKVILGLLGVGAAVAAAVAYKRRDKIEARKIEKLRKKGYVVYKPEEGEVFDFDRNAIEVQEADTEE